MFPDASRYATTPAFHTSPGALPKLPFPLILTLTGPLTVVSGTLSVPSNWTMFVCGLIVPVSPTALVPLMPAAKIAPATAVIVNRDVRIKHLQMTRPIATPTQIQARLRDRPNE